MKKKGLGELLVQENLIDLKQLAEARKSQGGHGGRLSSALVSMGAVSEDKITAFLGQQYNYPTVNLNDFDIDSEAIKLISKAICEKHSIIPVSKADRSLVVAFADPTNLYVKDDLSLLTRRKIEVVVASESSILGAIERYYGGGVGGQMARAISAIEDSEIGVGKEQKTSEVVDTSEDQEEGPIVKFVNAMLTDAIKLKASDIHIEPYEKRMRIRLRIDGTLHEKIQPPSGAGNAIVSRIKVMCKLDIAERRRPQDGRLKVKLKSGKEVDFRVSCLPTMFGEKVVLRLLDKSNLQVDMTKLGFEESELESFIEVIRQPQGMVLITGPTGSGKTTTIYSALDDLNRPEKNLSTAEDPVEFNLDGINQVQVNADIGFGFPEALRSFLRQDPEIIMVGEIRDSETAGIAYKAASTGHLVVSTLHTNDAASTITRLIEMGVPKYIVAESTSMVVAQRLLRMNCTNCSSSEKVGQETLLDLGVPEAELGDYNDLFKGEGCNACNMTGLSGRMAIFEVMKFSLPVKEVIFESSSPLEIKRVAMANGMSSLRQSALVKLKRGQTTVREVVNVSIRDEI